MTAQLIIGIVIGMSLSILFGVLRSRGSGSASSGDSRGGRESSVAPDGTSQFLSDVLDALTIGVVVASPDG
ncbi:MAG: hypothetical protein ACKOI2_02185, partial [Actinomycetota bacterium]